MLNDHRIRIIIGHYGSGKTEFSVNYVMKLAEAGRKAAIADMDVVNPYFRSREKSDMLEEKGIRVISSALGHKVDIDIPMVSAEVLSPLQDHSYDCVLDVGGNSVGAMPIAQFSEYFVPGDYDMFCVVNRYRSQTNTVEGVMNQIREIEAVVGARVTGLVNNTHLLRETTVEDVLFGQELVEAVSKQYHIPVKYIVALEKVAHQLPQGLEGEVFPIQMYMRQEWL